MILYMIISVSVSMTSHRRFLIVNSTSYDQLSLHVSVYDNIGIRFHDIVTQHQPEDTENLIFSYDKKTNELQMFWKAIQQKRTYGRKV